MGKSLRSTRDQDSPDGHVALLLSDDLEFGGAPLYLWISHERPAGNLIERNGLAEGQLYVVGERLRMHGSPQDWNGTGTLQRGSFTPLQTRNPSARGSAGHDPEGYLNDTLLRAQGVRGRCVRVLPPGGPAHKPRQRFAGRLLFYRTR